MLLQYTQRPPRLGHSGPIPQSIAERFYAKVDRTGECWLWCGSLWSNGYGRLRVGSTVDGSRREVLTHRLSYEMHIGPIPEGLSVCHDCPDGDNPRCVNPAHLFLGTHQDNTDDCHRKKRHCFGERHPGKRDPSYLARGERSGQSKLLERQVREIRSQYRPVKGSLTTLARRYGVNIGTIRQVVEGKTWRHVK